MLNTSSRNCFTQAACSSALYSSSPVVLFQVPSSQALYYSVTASRAASMSIPSVQMVTLGNGEPRTGLLVSWQSDDRYHVS